MKFIITKKLISLLVVAVLTLSINSSTFVFNVSAADVNNWSVGGTGENVILSANGSATDITFNAGYDWSKSFAQLPNKLIPKGDKTFSFKFKATNLVGGWIPFVLCWSSATMGSLMSNGLFFNVTDGNIEMRDVAEVAAISNSTKIANVPINTTQNHIVTVKLIDEATSTIKVSVDGTEAVRYQSASMASMLKQPFPLNDELQGLTLCVGGTGNTAITFDSNTSLWETVGDTSNLTITNDTNTANLKFTGGDFNSVYAQIPNKFKPIFHGSFGFDLNLKSLSNWAVLMTCWAVTNGSPVTSNSGVFFILEPSATGYQFSVKRQVSDAEAALGPFPINLNTNYQITISCDTENNITIKSNNIELGTYNDASIGSALILDFPYAGFAGLTLATAGGGAYEMSLNSSPYLYAGDYKLSTTNVITKIQPETKLSDFENALTVLQGATVTFSNASGPILDLNMFAGTDITVDLVINGDKVSSYKMLLYGDIDGSGKIDLVDLVAIRSCLLDTPKLEGLAKEAGNLYNENDITLNDLVGIMAYISENGTINQNR